MKRCFSVPKRTPQRANIAASHSLKTTEHNDPEALCYLKLNPNKRDTRARER